MTKEVTDAEGITWSCIQAYAGLSQTAENQEAAKVNEDKDTYRVVCTPSGGAQSVRLELQGDWESSYSDDQLLQEIAKQRQTES
ncbi:hypothetical protein NDA01_08300 [Trichocoleus desertorum AS-A10]|uniref:hypothetical protein n=1 Tax=Trichocoleus desertorum TaxID=1481672 RepID=UPI0032993779